MSRHQPTLTANRPGMEARHKTRRSAEEVDRLACDAARRLFALKGYTGSTTREIAALAGVHEPLLYRRYGSKAGLFRAAVLVPFGEVISGYLKTWEAQIDEPAPLRELVEGFINPLYRLLREHRELALALVQGHQLIPNPWDTPDDSTAWPAEIAEILQRLVPQLEIEGARRGLHVGASTTNVLVLGMVLGVALFDPVLPTNAVNATPAQLSQAMVELILHGVSPNEACEPEPPPADAPVTTQLLIELHDRVVAAERRAARAESALAHHLGIPDDRRASTEAGDTNRGGPDQQNRGGS
ncbi:TetR/AcrR family transcriptional regulator [Mycobacterium timonense]|uniref:TetR/AcrR family transcriptional regulator n=3 Tax=Mycobacterium avium complex (MAC) TaxID=120793 RepID=A0AAW5S875_MYCBC|nr:MULTISPECIES: TetR/AcrR family transcriptional regulator [Mycobacterium avium complex (MAC)]MCA2292840.1 TetR/AcrR family transcriptional regulator [Mycobacterium avium]MCV6991586.1 TetR/AcrR family transcriptional regulator [Mycobacterium bouchedurhonense]MCV6994989.1 TetR/AcrR family transcriptional regulator [Mycobacterium timonense]